MSSEAVLIELEAPAPRPSIILVPSRSTSDTVLVVRTQRARVTKRAVDLVITVPLTLLLAPVLIALALCVRCTSPGPALFRQQRIGRDGEAFTLLKLRTMNLDAEERLRADPALAAEYRQNGFKLDIERDPRVTRLGQVLRRTSLDELPQLLNVLAGSMSLVGPRPVLDEELEALYGPDRSSYEAVKPGMTGLWQVSGRSHVTHAARAELDEHYVRSWSFARDLVLLVRTIPAVLRGVGAH